MHILKLLGLLFCVCSDMNHQILRPRENFVTLGARVFFNSCVDFIVFIQVTGLGKGLVTRGADNGLVSSV